MSWPRVVLLFLSDMTGVGLGFRPFYVGAPILAIA